MSLQSRIIFPVSSMNAFQDHIFTNYYFFYSPFKTPHPHQVENVQNQSFQDQYALAK